MHPLSSLFASALNRLLPLLRCLALLGVLLGAASPALGAKTYSDNGDGTVTDPTTGLQWMRCSMGQTWDGATSTCTGTASTYTWGQAMALTNTVTFALHSDWRLPNIRELQTIVDRSVYNPAINAVTFPNILSFYFVSSTRSAGYNGYVWAINFHDGLATYTGTDQGVAYQVRLVRAGQPLGLLDIARPNSDYVVQGDGTAMHNPTMLTWQRCAIGQTWNGSACTGVASTYTWDQAKLLVSNFAGKTDWRLPTEEELLSLVDYSRYYPATNPSLFPDAPSSYRFWSASPYAYGSDMAWQVYFNVSNADGISARNDYNGVRLVRSGLSFGPLTLTISKTGIGAVATNVMPGIECGSLCSGGYNSGDVVTLNATPTANFLTWGGACASSGATPTCTVTMDSAKSVTASFKDTPLLTDLPTLLTFSPQNIASTSPAQHVTLTNTGTAALTSLVISASTEYAVDHNCGSGLGAGGNCTLNIAFTPAAIGTRTGTITINSNAPGTPHSIALTGTGQGSTSVASPTTLSFAAQGVGTTSPAQTVTLSNTGGALLNITSKVANGDFAISASTCGATLAQASSCSISVTFKPTTLGALSGSLVISSDALASPTTTVALNGTGVAVALVSLNPTSLSFAAQTVGTSSAEQAVVLTNTGGAALTLAAGSIVASAEFALSSNTCGGGLGAGGICNLGVTFTPSATGNRIGTLTITSNAVGSPTSLGLTGSGRSPNAPLCILSAVPAKLRKGETATLTASCSPAATSYVWSGGNCGAVTSNTCIESVSASTTYSVTGSSIFGSSSATATVSVRQTDLTPILMLLLD